MKLKSIFLLCLLPVMASAQTNYQSQVWSPDNGDGTYTNPVINADYSDPDICVGPSGKDYFMTASSFNCIPGLPILHSTDLVNWRIIGYALSELRPLEVFNKPAHGMGVWAPCIRYHNGEFYIYWGDPDYGVFMVKTKDPAGRWDDPVLVIEGKGMIDTSPLWDEDGRCYLVNGWAGSRSNVKSMLSVRELSADGSKAIGQPVIVFDGNNTHHTAEGPKFYKRNGWYWIMCPAGGVATGWQLAMRSKSPYGPYECKKVMAQGKSSVNGPHQGGWVHTTYGEDWFLHFQDKGAYGRVVHLQPVTWKDNWPVMGKVPTKGYCGEPYLTYRKPKSEQSVLVNPVESDEFNEPRLGLQWQWHANYNQLYGQPTSYGFFRLYNNKLSENFVNLWEAPNLLLQKTPADEFVVTTKVRVAAKQEGNYGGLIMMGRDYSALVIKRVGEAFQLQQLTCIGADKNKKETVEVLADLQPTEKDKINYDPAIYEELYLQLTVHQGGKMTFAYSKNGKKFTAVGKEFTMKEGKWIGAKFGFVAEQPYGKGVVGFMDIDWVRISQVAK
ncbi:MAG: glycoside hydrolase 43 family protein [Prevotella sp.]|nr:glycoside hydrolase 43 family protein [Prevotella sp.]MDY6093346.1 glycoside hydrolase 43 family protein [Prevotella sp.]